MSLLDRSRENCRGVGLRTTYTNDSDLLLCEEIMIANLNHNNSNKTPLNY
jgi:hypothetical protein